MRGLNRVFIGGHLGADPELRDAGTTKVAKMRVATTDRFKDKDYTEWHSIEAWGLQAEHCAKYLRKGSKVFIEGSIHHTTWESEGKKHYKTVIKAESVQFLDSKSKEDVVATLPEADIPF